MIESIRLQNLPSYVKVFIGLFTTLMLCVCAWAVFILYLEKGVVSPQQIPPYVTQPYGQKDTTNVQQQKPEEKQEISPEQKQRRLKRNVKLAHTHINGQTLLFFGMGLVFLFTSVNAKTKKIIFWVFGVSVVVHNIGLTGENFHPIYEDMLIVSGILILTSIAYMAFIVYADLLKKPAEL